MPVKDLEEGILVEHKILDDRICKEQRNLLVLALSKWKINETQDLRSKLIGLFSESQNILDLS